MNLSKLSPLERPLAEAVIARCIISREFFIKEILEVKEIEEWQLKTIRALDNGETKLSIRSGHGVGKTCMVAWLALHFLCFRDDVKVIVTSPSAKQMSDGLIPEITKWTARMPEWMSSQIDATSDRMVRKPNIKNNFISFRTARKENPEALAGVHAEHVMILVDEASGVDEVIYETGQGALSTKGAIAILIGNPTKPSGFFYKTQTTLRDLWWTMKVSCAESSRVDESYIASQLRTYGADSREFAVRVLGDFPSSGADSVIPRSFAEGALKREVSPILHKGVYWGIDPGRGGDPTGFVERSANQVTDTKELRYVDLMQVVGWVKSRWDATPEKLRPTFIFVDSNGLGAGVADRLLELDLPIVHVNVAESAATGSNCAKLRDEIWFKGRSWLEAMDVSIDPDMPLALKLVEELVAPEYTIQSTGKTKVESKVELKARGVPSPNIADAFLMTFAFEGAVQSGSYSSDGWGFDTSKFKAPHVV